MKIINQLTKFWLISDCHWFHSKTIFEFGLRPQFKSVEDMNKCMWDNWCEKVSENDDIWFLGDWVIGHPNKYGTAQILYDNLPGVKHFIKGNHDNALKECTNIPVEDGPVQINYKGKSIVLCHEPIFEFSQDYQCCGHLHNNEDNKLLKKNMFNCSVEMIDFAPILIDEVIEKIEKRT